MYNLYITPVSLTFSPALVEAYLDCQPDVIKDPHAAGTYLMCGIPYSAPELYRSRVEKPERFPYVTTIRIAAHQVQLDQEYGTPEQWRSALEFMRLDAGHFRLDHSSRWRR